MTCGKCGNEGSGQFCSHCGNTLAVAIQPVPRQAVQQQPAQQMLPNVINQPVQAVGSVQSLQSSMHGIGQGNITNRANFIQNTNDESMVWEEKPSLALLAGKVVKYIIIMLVFLWIVSSAPPQTLGYWPAVFLLFLVLRFLYRFLELRSTRYRMSSQRLVIDRGVFTRVSVPYELHTLGNSVVQSTAVLRMFGRGNLTIVGQGITLRGIRNPEAVRDLLRNAGQWEASRMDKIRWR
jgi:hypothetical protein